MFGRSRVGPATSAPVLDDLAVRRALAEPERARLVAILERTGRELDAAFDELATLARDVTRGDEAYVVLVGADRMLHRGRTRGDGPRAFSLGSGFCPYSVAEGRVLAIPDALADERFRENPAVAAGVRAYLGVPLVADGHPVGTVCVVTADPRSWSDDDAEQLIEISERVTGMLLANGQLRRAG